MNLGEKIKFVRNTRGFTQKELAEKIGVSLRSLQHYEANDITPKTIVIQKIAEVCNWGMNFFNSNLPYIKVKEQTNFNDQKPIIFSDGYKHPLEVWRISNSVDQLKEIVDSPDNIIIRQNIYLDINQICNSLIDFEYKLKETPKKNIRKEYIKLKSKTMNKILENLETLLLNIYRGINLEEEK